MVYMRNGRLYYLCWQLNPTIMYSSEDLERFYFQYQTEAVPHGVSLQSFCSTNNVPYNLFHKWYKDTRRKIVEVQVDGVPWVPPPRIPFRLLLQWKTRSRRTVLPRM